MRTCVLLTVLVAAAAGCDAPTNPIAEPSASQQSSGAATMSGADAYEAYCASCHTDGVDDAPRLGVTEDWEGRSQLWQAVLFEHAKAGYLAMPAKGGAGDAADREVAAAAEYMMERTFGDRPVD